MSPVLGKTLAEALAAPVTPAPARRGRPPLGADKREPVQVYLTADERAELEAYAEREGEPLGGAIREAALRAARWRP